MVEAVSASLVNESERVSSGLADKEFKVRSVDYWRIR